jgi:hypothetical protein
MKTWAQRLEPYVPPVLFGKAYLLTSALTYLRDGTWARLRENERYRDLHRGERCFVIGNGPSLKHMDLAPLRNEHVFTTNLFIEHQERLGIEPLAYCLIDPLYFDAKFEDFKTLKYIRDHGSKKTRCFFPLDCAAVAERFVPDAGYLLFRGDLKNNKNTDLRGPLPALQTVTLAAMLLAMYMGFDRIYLIGCDMDMLSHVIGVSPLTFRNHHFYKEDDDTVTKAHSEFDYATFCMAIRTQLEGYREVGRRARPGQQILNAGVGGLLDLFPRVDYGSLFK